MSGIRVIGDSYATSQIRQALQKASVALDANAALWVVSDWENLDSLRRLASNAHASWLLIESADADSVAIGPLFEPAGDGCFSCYLARRQANGAVDCRPASSYSERALSGIVEAVKRLLSGDRNRCCWQQVIRPDHESAQHLFQPVPTCQDCRQHRTIRKHRLQDLVSDRIGLIHKVNSLANAEPFAAVRAVGCHLGELIGDRGVNHGMAVDVSREQAEVRAIAESLERYCAALPSGLTFASERALSGSRLDPRSIASCAIPAGDDDVLGWLQGQHLANGEPVWIPAAAVCLPYLARPGEPAPAVQCSTGLAAGRDRQEAIEHGLMEVLERDLFMRAWCTEQRVERIVNAPIPGQAVTLCRIPNELDLEVVVAFFEADVPPLSAVGLAARRSRPAAIKAACLEAFANQVWLKEWLRTSPPSPSFPPRTLEEHARVHAVRPDLRVSRLPWLHPARNAPPERPTTSLEPTANLPAVYVVDVTTADVASAGISVARVLVPDRVRLEHDAMRPVFPGCRTPHPLA